MSRTRLFATVVAGALIAGTLLTPAAAGPGLTKTTVKKLIARAVNPVKAGLAAAEGSIAGLQTSVVAAEGSIAGLQTSVAAAQASIDAHKGSADHDSRYWKLGGNAGTGGTAFLGTTDDVPFELRANGSRVLLIRPDLHVGNPSPSLVGGSPVNAATPGLSGATISGGGSLGNANSVTDSFGTVAGGHTNRAGNDGGTLIDAFSATVSGGELNMASATLSTIGGGRSNTASAPRATVGGGEDNDATGQWATVGGGRSNAATTTQATVGGGGFNDATGDNATVGGGATNVASGTQSTVGGGLANIASGLNATVAGGLSNTAAGAYSVAGGRRAKIGVAHGGAFLFADQTDADFASAAANEFAVRASGGFRFRTQDDLLTGCNLPAGSGTFECTSDRASKAAFAPIDPAQVLNGVATLPLSTWRFKGEDDSVTHLGPVAQDFRAAFGLGSGDTTISSVDADGVALAAIQGLNQKVEEQQDEIEVLRASAGTRPAPSPLQSLVWGLAGLGLGLGVALGSRLVRRA